MTMDLVNGSHMEPIQGGRNNAFDARFLACTVADHKPSCDAIFTDRSAPSNMCNKEDYVECDIVAKTSRS